MQVADKQAQPWVSGRLASPSALRPPHLSLCFLIRFYASGQEVLQARGIQLHLTPRIRGKMSVFLLEQIKGEEEIQYPSFWGLVARLKQCLGQEGAVIGEVLQKELKVKVDLFWGDNAVYFVLGHL